MHPKIPIYLITGFLGSGKTTLLQRIIKYFNGKQKIAIVQNEFAPANFDGKELKRTSNAEFELLEINNGSVFCVCQLSGFIESLYSFTNKHTPDIIFMEASGLSDPVSVGQIFNSPKLQDIVYMAGIICIVDALNYDKFDKLVTRIEHQLQIADIVLINKTDLIDKTSDIEVKIKKTNPFASLYSTTYCNIPPDRLFSNPLQKQKKLLFMPGISEKPDIYSLVFRSAKPLHYKAANIFIHTLANKFIRIKGYIKLDNNNSLSIQCIANEIQTTEIQTNFKQTELILIGYNNDLKYIKELYNL